MITDEPDLGDHHTFPGHFPTESSLFDFGARPELTALTLGGFASAAFARVLGTKSGGGVGDDAHSWAVDGARQLKWPNGEEPYKCTWQAGDFIGLACDLDAMRELSASSSSSPPTQDR